MVAVTWQELLSSSQRDELLTLRNFRHRTIQQVGLASLEVARAEDVLGAAKGNLKTGQVAVRELEDRIARRLRLFLGENADKFSAVDIDDL